jgi:colanic acid/amylovoran biosynthesis glycosyltransferase
MFGIRLPGYFYRDAALVALAPEIVHFQFGAEAVGRERLGTLLDCAIVATFQGYDLNYQGIGLEPGYYAELWRRVDAVHVLSGDLARVATRRGLPQSTPIVVAPHAVDPLFLEGEGRRHEGRVGSRERPFRLLSVGRLHWTKGHEYTLRAVRALIDSGLHCEYRIVGDGDLREALLFAIEDLDLRGAVSLLGPLDPPEVRDQMGRADVLVHSAVSEGFCVAVAEAQAMQLPVVASDAGGLPENVADGQTGFIVPRRDTHTLALKLRELAGDPDLRSRMGRAGRARVRECFQVDQHAQQIEKLYETATARSSAPLGR